MIEPEECKVLIQAIEKYYATHSRDLPWRKSQDPYAVWISEIMLQQTRVTAVIPYFERWMAQFPTISALARASLDDVLANWSGLGYYSRARNIHRCAKELVVNYGGVLPRQAKDLRALPGIGPYTAGAISSIAYGQKEALVDGNVARLFARLFAISDNIKTPKAKTRLWQIGTRLVPLSKDPGSFNQGLMELGALVCTPTNPKCDICPVKKNCVALRDDRVLELPVTTKPIAAKDKPLLQRNALFVFRNQRLLLGKRRAQGLYGGLWELPQSEACPSLEEMTGLTLRFLSQEPILEHNQILSHRRLLIRVWPALASGQTVLAKDSPYEKLGWHSLNSLSKLGLSAATTTILKRRSELIEWTTRNRKQSAFLKRGTQAS